VSGADERPWSLFRYRHADGTAKDWAYRPLPDGGVELRWGKAGRLTQHTTYPPAECARIQRRARDKQRKGYVALGPALIRDGRIVPQPAASPARLEPTPTTSQPTPPLDLSRIAPGREDFWF